VVDLEGGIDRYADHFVWYKYWPIADGALPNLTKLWEMAQKVQDFTSLNNNVLDHCAGG
jgi:protein-tyrosine phosphatase